MNIQVEVFWVVTSCSAVVGYRRFGGPYCLHHPGNGGGNFVVETCGWRNILDCPIMYSFYEPREKELIVIYSVDLCVITNWYALRIRGAIFRVIFYPISFITRA
jgi:hypothetical protein